MGQASNLREADYSRHAQVAVIRRDLSGAADLPPHSLSDALGCSARPSNPLVSAAGPSRAAAAHNSASADAFDTGVFSSSRSTAGDARRGFDLGSGLPHPGLAHDLSLKCCQCSHPQRRFALRVDRRTVVGNPFDATSNREAACAAFDDLLSLILSLASAGLLALDASQPSLCALGALEAIGYKHGVSLVDSRSLPSCWQQATRGSSSPFFIIWSWLQQVLTL